MQKITVMGETNFLDFSIKFYLLLHVNELLETGFLVVFDLDILF